MTNGREAAKQQGSAGDTQNGTDARWYVHTSHDAQACTTHSFLSLHEAAEYAADAIVNELREHIGYATDSVPLLTIPDHDLPDLLVGARVDAVNIQRETGTPCTDADAHGAIAARIARRVNLHDLRTDGRVWTFGFSGLRLTIQRA